MHYCHEHVNSFNHSGAVTLFPSGVAPVCSGDELELTCTTTADLLQWRFMAIHGNEPTAIEFTRTITSTGSAMLNVIINSTVFNFSRISAHNSVPLMSRLVISPVSNGLNGTVMNCVDAAAGEVSSTTIIVGERGALQGIVYANYTQLYYYNVIYRYSYSCHTCMLIIIP